MHCVPVTKYVSRYMEMKPSKKKIGHRFCRVVVVFGRCHLVESGARAITLLKRFAMKYYPSEQLVDEEITHAGKAVQIFEIEVEYLSGKEIQER